MFNEVLISDHHGISQAIEIDLLVEVGVVLIEVEDEFGGIIQVCVD